MKTPSNRVHRKTSTKLAAPQAPTIAPAPKPKQYTLSLISFDGSKVITEGEVVISPEQMEMINQNSPTERVEGHEFINYEKILNEGLAKMLEKPALFELESAINQNDALLQIFLERFENDRGEGTSFHQNTGKGQMLICGLQELVWTTQNRLAKALAKGN